jgi:leucyl-tRNA synthetase
LQLELTYELTLFYLYRLYTLIDWVKECLATVDQLRDSDYTFNDQVFDNEMNLKIVETNQNYDRMLFKGT